MNEHLWKRIEWLEEQLEQKEAELGEAKGVDVLGLMENVDKYSRENKQLKAELAEKEAELKAADAAIDEGIKQYDERVEVFQIDIDRLEAELEREKEARVVLMDKSYTIGVDYAKDTSVMVITEYDPATGKYRIVPEQEFRELKELKTVTIEEWFGKQLKGE